MKLLPAALVSVLFLSTSACSFFGNVGGRPGQAPGVTAGAGAADATAAPPVDPTAEPTTGEPGSEAPSVDGAPSASATVSGTVAPVPELDTAALCTKASTCTTSVSIALCGMINPKCLDAFHKHADGADRAGCQAKLDRLPELMKEWGKPGVTLPPECR